MEFFVFKIDHFNVVKNEVDAVFFPKKILVGLDVFPFHVAHVDVHEGGAAEKMGRFRADDRDVAAAQFSERAGGGGAGDAVAEDDYFHFQKNWWAGGMAKSVAPAMDKPNARQFGRAFLIQKEKSNRPGKDSWGLVF